MRQYKINGRRVWLLSISEVSKLTGVSTRALRAWEVKGILPKASVVRDMHSPIYGECSRRLYTEEQARALTAWVAKVKPGKGVVIKPWMIEHLHKMWEKATEQFKKEIEGEGDGSLQR